MCKCERIGEEGKGGNLKQNKTNRKKKSICPATRRQLEFTIKKWTNIPKEQKQGQVDSQK